MMAPASLKGSEHYPASLSLPNLGKTLRILLLSGGSSSQTVGITLTLAREMAICPNSGDQAACCPGVRSTRQHHPPFQDSDLAHSPGPRPPGVHPPGVHPPWGPPCLSSILPGVYPPWGPPSRGPFSLEPALLGPILPGARPPGVYLPGAHTPWGPPSWGLSSLGSTLLGPNLPGLGPPVCTRVLMGLCWFAALNGSAPAQQMGLFTSPFMRTHFLPIQCSQLRIQGQTPSL